MVLGLLMIWRLKDSPHVRLEVGGVDNAGKKADRVPISVIFRELRGKPTVLLLAMAFAGMAFVDIGYVTWMPTFLQEKYKMSPASAGFSSMFYHHAAAFVGILLSGRLTDLWSRKRRSIRIEAQMLGLLCGVPFIYMMGMSNTPALCFIGMGIFGLFRGIYESNLYATLFEVVAPRLRSSAVGGMICGAFLVGALSPVIMGALKKSLGLGISLAGLSGVYLLSGIFLLIAWAYFYSRDCVSVVEM
jgi:sugar phosphate permease